MIRWSYLAPRALALALVWGFFVLCFDGLAERGVETGASRALGAKVELGGLMTKFFPPKAVVHGFSAADPQQPMTNLVEFSTLRFALEGDPLLKKKFIVEEGALEGLTWGTPRKTSGALAAYEPSRSEQRLEAYASKSSDLLGDLADKTVVKDYKVKPEDLGVLKAADETAGQWSQRFAAWDTKLRGLGADERTKNVEDKFKRMQDEGNVAKKIQLAKEVADEAKVLRDEVRETRVGVLGEVARSKSDLDNLERLKDEDIQALESKLKLPSFDTDRLTTYFLGDRLAKRLGKTLGMIQTVRERLPAKSAPKVHPAARGVNVEFPSGRALPGWWVKHLKLSGEGAGLKLAGEAKNFSSLPANVDKPATVVLKGQGDGGKMQLFATLDHREERAKDGFLLDWSGFEVPAFQTGDGDGLGVKVSKGKGLLKANIELEGSNLEGKIDFAATGVSLTPSAGDSADPTAQVLAAALEGLDKLVVSVKLSGTLQSPKWELASNLGTAAAKGLERTVGKKIAAQRAKLRAQVDGLYAGKRREMEALLGKVQGTLTNRVDLADSRLRSLEDRAKAEASKVVPKIEAPKDLGKKLKGLF